MLSENVLVPSYNSTILIVPQIIRNVMSSAAETKLAGLLIYAKEMVPLRKYLKEMG